MRVDTRHEAKMGSESLFSAGTSHDYGKLGTFWQARVSRTELLGPARIVGIESAHGHELIAGLNTSRGGGALRDYLSYV